MPKMRLYDDPKPPDLVDISLSRASGLGYERVDVVIGGIHAICIHEDGTISFNVNCKRRLEALGFQTDETGRLKIKEG